MKHEEKKEVTQHEVQKSPVAVERASARRTYVPRADIVETNDALLLFADLPGTSEKSVDVTLEDSVLTIRSSADFKAPEGQSPAYTEFFPGDYERVFTLSEVIDRDRIEASVRNGLLRLRLPKAAPHQAKKIAVRAV